MYVHKLDPTIFQLGPLQVRWYGLMYVLGFVVGGQLLKILTRKKFFNIEESKVDSLLTYALVGLFFGARLAYVFIYNFDYYQYHLTEIFSVWQGGLSFHGGLVGIIIGLILFAKKNNVHFIEVFDSVALSAPPGIFFGRMGNFINGELWGHVTNVPWAVLFPTGGPLPRHPSQLYEGFSEGLLITLILWTLLLSRKVKFYGIISGLFVLMYGVFRFIIEFYREADEQLGYYFHNTLSMGQILCMIMILGSGIVFYLAIKYKKTILLKS